MLSEGDRWFLAYLGSSWQLLAVYLSLSFSLFSFLVYVHMAVENMFGNILSRTTSTSSCTSYFHNKRFITCTISIDFMIQPLPHRISYASLEAIFSTSTVMYSHIVVGLRCSLPLSWLQVCLQAAPQQLQLHGRCMGAGAAFIKLHTCHTAYCMGRATIAYDLIIQVYKVR